jgi:hypothetical protein
MPKAKKYEAPMTPMQKKEWIKSVKQVDKRSQSDDVKKTPPMSVRKPPPGKKLNPKAVKDYDKVITKKLNKDDRKKK